MRNASHILLAICFLNFTSVGMCQDNWWLCGMVTDSASQNALSSVTINLPELLLTTQTDSNGYFEFKIPAGSYHLSFTHPAYQVLHHSLTVSSSISLPVNLAHTHSDQSLSFVPNMGMMESQRDKTAIQSLLSRLRDIFLHKIWQ